MSAAVQPIDPIERFGAALLQPLYEEQERRRGAKLSRRTGVPGLVSIGEIPIGGAFGELTADQLAYIGANPDLPMSQEIETECSQGCGERFKCMALFSKLTACDVCRAKAERDERLRVAKSYWESICPGAYRDTDKAHAGFPKAQYMATKAWNGESSLLLYGDTRMGKSRLGVWLIKRCLVKMNMHVGILWPEMLKNMKKTFTPLEELHRFGAFDVLLMDDALLAAAMDARLTDWLKDLIDYRMRHKRHCIITSQIGSADYKEQSNKFAEATGADKKLIEALCARVSEICTVVPFVSAQPTDKEEAF